MFSTITSGAIYGIDSYLTQIEVDTAQGLPGFDMVGFLGNEVKEARERVRVALKNAGFNIPPVRITVNISPANVRKEGTAFDLPIALGILSSMNILPFEKTKNILFLGELGLNGEIKFVKGVLPIVMEAKKMGMESCIVPFDNRKEGEVVENITVIGMKNISQVIQYLKASNQEQAEIQKQIDNFTSEDENSQGTEQVNTLNFSEINGQEIVKRATLIAAAGFHHLLMIGPPGSGKTMIAKRISTILPPLTHEESMEVSKIYSVSGMLNSQESVIRKRPFLSPHHTISEYALVGGGRIPKPGIISLAHRGILFLDEMPEFHRNTLDILRQPLEDKKVQIARAYGNYTYPSDFILVGAMNPCPCGYFPDLNKCRCTPFEVKRYINRISGPILDRIDITTEAPKIEIKDLLENRINESSEKMRARVMEARNRQEFRYKGSSFLYNSQLGPQDIKNYCPLGIKEHTTLERAFYNMNLSARGFHRIIKVARTIADIEGVDKILSIHLAEAISYRANDKKI